MKCTCNECNESFDAKKENPTHKILDREHDKDSTMYKDTFNVTCPYCNHKQEETDEYWENDVTGDRIE